MFNPWILLGLLVFWLASVGGAYYKGSQNAQEEARAQFASQLEATIQAHNADAEIDMNAAFEWGQRNSIAKTKSNEIRGQANDAIRAQPLAVTCNWDTATFGLLTSAVKAASELDPAASERLSKAVRDANASSK